MTDSDDEPDGRSPAAGLSAFYSPRQVVVVGASRQAGKLGHDVLVQCAQLGFSGSMFGVNPLSDGERVAGWPLVRSLEEVPEPPDLALIAVPAKRTLEAVADCARAGVRAAVIAAAGFGELGGEGSQHEEEIARTAREAGMRLLGPNGFGLYVGPIGLNLMAWRDIPLGEVALVTQSGNVAIALCRLMTRSTLGLSSCTGVGNQVDVGIAELLAFHARSTDSDSVALYVEGLRGTPGGHLMDALADCRAAGKPVVALKGGRSTAGNRSVTTHTGALGGSSRLWDVALPGGGALQVSDAAEMVETLEALRATRARRVRAVLVLSDGGGDTVLASDALEDAGVPLAPLAAGTQAALDHLAPVAAPRAEGQNPVTLDTAGGLEDDPRLLARCAEVGAADEAVDAVVVCGTFGGYRKRREEELEVVARLVALHAGGTPVLVHSAFAPDDEKPVLELRRAGIPVYRTARRLACSLASAIGAESPAGGPPSTERSGRAAGILPTRDAAALLESVGIALPPISCVSNEDDLAAALTRAPFPVCLKLEDPAVPHKSDVGGVVLDLGPDTVQRAANDLWRRFPGRQLVVMPMLPPGLELLVGLGFDETFGPYVTVGRGGLTAEVDPDVSTAIAPVDVDAAMVLWSSLRCAPLLYGWRSSPAVDLAALASLAASLSRLGASHPGLEIECNPVLAYPAGYAVADLRAVRDPS